MIQGDYPRDGPERHVNGYRWKNTKTGDEGRHHVHETILQRAVKEAMACVVRSMRCEPV